LAYTVAGVTAVGGGYEERHPGQVVVELEEVDIHAVHRLDPHADEPIGQLGDLGTLTDDLPVEVGAGQSALAAEDHEQRLARLARQALALRVAVDPVDLAVDRAGRGN